MAEFKFNCPQCKKEVISEESQKGKVIRCPHCEKGIVVPRNPVKTKFGIGGPTFAPLNQNNPQTSPMLEIKPLRRRIVLTEPARQNSSVLVTVKCPHCGNSYVIERKDLKGVAKCETCGKIFTAEEATKLQIPSSRPKVAILERSGQAASIDIAGVGCLKNKMHLFAYCSLFGIGLINMILLVFVCVCLSGLNSSAPEKNILLKEEHHQDSFSNSVLVQTSGAVESISESEEKDSSVVAETVSPAGAETEIPHSNGRSPESVIVRQDKAMELPSVEDKAHDGADIKSVVQRICNGKRLTGKEWDRRMRREFGIDRLHDSLKMELRKAGYWAIRIEEAGMAINVGRTTNSTTGFIREGLGGGFTFPSWLPEDDAEYIYRSFVKLDETEKALLKRAQKYTQAFRESEFYITPEEEDRIEQEERLKYAKPLFSSLCFDPPRYFYIQKRVSLSVLSAKITDRRWKQLAEAQSKENWLGMMNIIDSEEGGEKYNKYPSKEAIASIYNKIREHKWNVEVRLKNTGVPPPVMAEQSDWRRIAEAIRNGVSKQNIINRYSEEQYTRCVRFNGALKNMQNESIPYPIDIRLRIDKVEKNGVIKNIRSYYGESLISRSEVHAHSSYDFNASQNSSKVASGSGFEFEFSIGGGCVWILFVDDEWYWKQDAGSLLRQKMAQYVNKQNAFLIEMASLCKAVNQGAYDKVKSSAMCREIKEKHGKQLFAAISNFMGTSVTIAPEPLQTEDRHEEDDDLSHYDLTEFAASYGINLDEGRKGDNRFVEYEQEKAEAERERAMVERAEARERDAARKEVQRERDRRNRETRRKMQEFQGPSSWGVRDNK